tara:strand:- start:145 stop:435 length:291 start_codon:yes stop_codon:yes gene_type:complete
MDKNKLKVFLIKLSSIVIAFIILINVSYNLILADKMAAINSLLLLNQKENRILLKDKIRHEIENGLSKDQILEKEDKELLYKFYLKLKKEFENIDN